MPRPGGLRQLALLGPPWLAGMALRLSGISEQVLGGDELHAVRAAARLAPLEILTRYGLSDYSLPLTALFSWLLRHGVVVGEMTLRAPSLLAGALSLVVLPVGLLRRLGAAPTAILAWLLALSPLLVSYSRIARSYMPMTLAAAAAVVAFDLWWEGGGRRWAVAYVALAGLALWLHLGAGPLLLSPLAFGAVDALARRQGRRERLLRVAGAGAALAAVWSAVLLPARESLRQLVSAKQGALLPTLGGAWDALRLQTGTVSHALAVVFWLVAAAGLARLARCHRRFALLTLAAAAGHAAGLAVLSPEGIANSLVLGRYLVAILPLVLLWVAYALAAPWSRAATPGAIAGRLLGAAGVVALFATGPLPGMVSRGGAFDHHNLYVAFVTPWPAPARGDLPPIYEMLDAGPILEFPWPNRWSYGLSFPRYQEIHGQPVLVAGFEGMPRHPNLVLRNEVPPSPQAILDSRARWLVVHRQLVAEEERLAVAAGMWPSVLPPGYPQRVKRVTAQLVARVSRRWGLPDHADEWIAAWDLDRVRRRASASAPR